MQIVIPMSGFGERFRRAGYKLPKPLIKVGGKPIIAHIIDLFPETYNGEHEFLFICNNEHLENPEYKMVETIKKYCPNGKIIGIPPHKLGPVYAVMQIANMIDEVQPVVVNYCDFSCFWNWQEFQKFVTETGCAGAIPAYKDFHPHTLGTTNYAYIRENNRWVLDIQEKQPYTDNRMAEYASSGTYYFATGKIMLEAFKKTIEQNLNVGGEYYVSLAYKILLAENKRVAIYPLQHFMQWGTPEDVEEYQEWFDVFLRLMENRQASSPAGTLIMPMAGLGKRFADEGYDTCKPLIEISGKKMVIQAALSLPATVQQSFILRSDMEGHKDIIKTLEKNFTDSNIKMVGSVTEGQACSALLGLDALENKADKIVEPITFAACDSAVQYDENKFAELCNNQDIDVIVWCVRKHANAIRNPQMFGWIDADKNGLIKNISVKKPLSSPATDLIVIGTFTFCKGDYFRKSVASLIDRNDRINGEFYLDSCINDAIKLGLHCHIFEVDAFISWGTPNDLRTFEYWQSCFHKWNGHAYSLEQDKTIAPEAIAELEKRYQEWAYKLPVKYDKKTS